LKQVAQLADRFRDTLSRTRLMAAVRNRLALLPAEHPVARSARALWRGQLPRGMTSSLFRRSAGPAAAIDQSFFAELLRRAAAAPSITPIPGRVVLVNAGLAAGGAERQIVNTLLGLRRQKLESVSFLGEFLDDSPDRTFMLPALSGSGIAVIQVGRRDRGYLKQIDGSVTALLELLPPDLARETADLVGEFRDRRPEIVHAWQDATSIKCGLAGIIAGVPRIVLSSRNLNPSNFAYYRSFMRPAYRALADRPEIVMSNNSAAGAADFCEWLDLPRERYTVVRNGVAFDGLQREAAAGRVLREREGIPTDAKVVGSIFRFWPEKRPLLWVQSALRLLDSRPDLHFLIAGDGPLRARMMEMIEGSRHAPAFHLIPPTLEIGPVLSALDVFLLTSRFEGTPNVILEAQWLGLPVVALNAGGVAEAVAPSGIVCADESPDTVASELLRVLSDPTWPRRASELAPRSVRERFGLERMIAETMALYGYGTAGAGITPTRET
jgi:glycosyltransferase involved in cell wall biosynthesis